MQFSGLFPTRLIGALTLLAVTLGAAQAKDDGTDPSVTIEKEIQANVINADGSFVVTSDTVILINEERAIKEQAQRSLSYNSTLETLDVIHAYTEKPDGRKVAVRPEQIKEQQELASAQAPMFQDTRVKVVIFPEVAIGDRMVLQFKKTRTTALFPGQFEDLSYPAFNPTRQFTLIYDLPADMLLYADAKGFAASTPAAAPGRRIYRWDYVPAQKARIEQGAVSYLDYGQYLAVSTFTDFAAFAKAYDSRAKVNVTPKVRELASSLTAHLDNPRAKAIALSEWVRKNIRYVAVYVGPGGVVPHPVETILANRYGDCKDHVALLEALLAAVGIESTPALVSLGNAYLLPEVPTLGVLNHAITFVPGLNLYLDSTAEGIAGGYLPLMVLDKPVVLTKTGVVARTPAVQENKVENTLLYKVSSKGAAEFTHQSNVTGWAAEMNRYGARSTKPADRDLMIQQFLMSYGLNGSGKMETGSLEGTDNHFELNLVGRVENLVSLPGPVGVLTMSSLVGGIAQNVFSLLIEPERTQAFACFSSVIEEQARFEFAKEIGILAAPRDVSLSHERFDYSANYTRADNAVVVKRRFAFKHPQVVCTPQDFEAMKASAELVLRDLKSQIIVQSL